MIANTMKRWLDREHQLALGALLVSITVFAPPAGAATPTVFFSTGNPDGKIATLSRRPAPGVVETETADDFILTTPMRITQATFTGLLPYQAPLSSVTDVEIELYHVFPGDSANPPSGSVPTRVNSPGDSEFAAFDSATGTITFTTTVVNPLFTVANTVVNGINRSPGQLTGGEGPTTGEMVLFTVTFNPPIILPADHYFFRPEVQLSTGNFLWLSAPKPIVAPGTPFNGDLQSWTRNANLAPDWLRIGTDITGQGPFNAAFSLTGDTNVGTTFFNTGDPDGKIATLSRVPATGVLETETADDFILTAPMRVTQATFTGLLPSGALLSSITSVEIEMYHVFPLDSTTPPSGNVPTRVNSPSDNQFAAFSSAAPHTLFFTPTLLNANFTVANSVVNGIHKSPNQFTGGEGSVTGEEVLITVSFNPPLTLPADHIFFRPEVQLSSGNFLWLSAPKPIVAPGTPFTGDLQSWTRNANLSPDWLRIGTDITAQGPFNAAFSLVGDTNLPTCQFSLNPTSVSIAPTGDIGSVIVTNSQNCEWSATSNSTFVTLVGGTSGLGNGVVDYSVQQNTGAARTGTLTIAGQTFTVNQASAGQPPPPVIIFSPGQGATGVSLNTTLTWGGVTGATSYDVYFGSSLNPPFVGNTAATSFSPGPLSPNTTYYWLANSKNAFGTTPSSLWFFTTGQGCAFSVSPVSVNIGNGSGTFAPVTGSFVLSASGCTAQNTWTATSASPRVLSISPASGNGAAASTTIGFSLFTATTTASKTYTINLAGLTVTINQAGSAESQLQRVVRALYQTVLGREPDQGGFQFWTGPGAPQNSAGVTLTNQMADGFYVSPEFANSGYVTMSIYQALLGRLPAIAEWQATVKSLRNNSLTTGQLVNTLMPAGLSTSAFVQLAIQNAYARAATAGEVTQFTNQITASTSSNPRLDFLTGTIFQSSEFQQRTNSQFIQMLYFTILVRDPDTGGFNFWLSQVAPPNGQLGIYYLYNPQPVTSAYTFKLAVIGQAVPPNPSLLGFLGSPEFQGLIQ